MFLIGCGYVVSKKEKIEGYEQAAVASQATIAQLSKTVEEQKNQLKAQSETFERRQEELQNSLLKKNNEHLVAFNKLQQEFDELKAKFSTEGLSILQATYGADSIQKDVTETTKAKIKNDKLKFFATSNELGGDPAFGKSKTLYIKYMYQGRAYATSIKEGHYVSLPPDTEQTIGVQDDHKEQRQKSELEKKKGEFELRKRELALGNMQLNKDLDYLNQEMQRAADYRKIGSEKSPKDIIRDKIKKLEAQIQANNTAIDEYDLEIKRLKLESSR